MAKERYCDWLKRMQAERVQREARYAQEAAARDPVASLSKRVAELERRLDALTKG